MLAERIEWYTACVNNDSEYITQKLEDDGAIYENATQIINNHNNEVRYAKTMGRQPPLVVPFTEKPKFLNVIDDRLTDFTKNVISGFTGLMYACYFDAHDVFQLLFDYEYKRTSAFEVSVHVAANTKTTRYVLPIDSNVLMLAIMRSSRRCLKIILEKMNEEGCLDVRDYFWKQVNRDFYNYLSFAALCSTNQNAIDLVTPEAIDAMILDNAETQASFFYICCYFGQYTALNKIYDMLSSEEVDPAVKQKIYTAALKYSQEVSLLESCQKKIDYYNFVSSYDLKVQCYNVMAMILQEALISLINYEGPEYDELRARWTQSPLKYYRLISAEQMEQSNSQTLSKDVENVEEIAIKYVEPLDQRLEKWFLCQDTRYIKSQLTELRRQMDMRELSYENHIYPQFMLIHYSLLFDNEAVFELIYEHEKLIDIQQETTIRLSNQELVVKKGTNVMQLAILLNSQRCVQKFVQLVNKGTWNYDVTINEDEETLLMYSCSIKNEASRNVWNCNGVIAADLEYVNKDDSKKNVFKRAIEQDNVYVLDKLVQLAGNPEYTPIVFVIVLAFKNQESMGFETNAISKYLMRMGLNYIQKASSLDIDHIMEKFLTQSEWAEKKQNWDLLQQCITGNFVEGETPQQQELLVLKRQQLVIQQAEQQLYCLLSYQSAIFNARAYNVQELEEIPKKVIWFDICFGGDQVKILAPMCLKYRDPRRTDVEGKVTFKNFTGLMYAIMGNNTAAIEYLLEHEYMEKLVEDEQVMTRFGTFLLKEGSSAYHLACAVADDKNFKLVQQFYIQHQEFDISCPQTITSLSIIFNRPLSTQQFEKDLLQDKQLLRYSVQNMSLDYVKKITAYLDNKRFRDSVKQNYLNVFESNFEVVNVYDIAVESFYSNLDDTTIQIKDIIKKALTQLIKQEHDDKVAYWFQEPFIQLADESPEDLKERRKQNGEQIIQQLEKLNQKQDLITQDENVIINQQFSIINPENDNLKQILENMRARTAQVSQYNTNVQTELQSEWFNACRTNNMESVRKISYMFKTYQELRPSDVEAMTHTSFTGLMYGIVYGNREVFQHLLSDEWHVLTQQATIFQYNGQYFYVPTQSSVLHLAVLVNNQSFIEKIVQEHQELFFQFNQCKISPFHLMVQRGVMMDSFFKLFVANLTEYHFDLAIKNCFLAQNTQFVQFLIQHHQTRIQEPLYQLVFKICVEIKENKIDPQQQPCQSALQILEEHAMLYAFAQLHQYNRALELGTKQSKACIWDELLKQKFQGEFDAAYKEYVDLDQYKQSGQVVIEEEKIVANYQRIENPEWIVDAPQKVLLITQQDKDLIQWFETCKRGNIEEISSLQNYLLISQNFVLAGQQDTRNNNYQKEIFTGFTGLMYAVYNDNIDVFRELLMFEGRIISNYKNVLNAQEITNTTPTSKDASDEPQITSFQYLANRGIGLVPLIFLRSATRVFSCLYNYETEMQFLNNEREQLQLNQLCASLKNQFYEYSNVFLYHQMKFDLLDKKEEFIDLFNKQLIINEKLISISLQHKNTVFAKQLYLILSEEYEKMTEIEFRLDFDDNKKQKEYNKCQQIPTIQVVMDIFECFLQNESQFEDEFQMLLEKATEIGICKNENSTVYRRLVRVYMQKDQCDKDIALENLDIQISHYLNSKLKSELVDDAQTVKVINNAYTVDAADIQQQECEVIADPWFTACYKGDLAFIKKNYDIFNKKADQRVFNFQNNIYYGFAGIHYAALNNQVEVIKLLFEAEGGLLTEEDVIIKAYGIGYDENFLLSCGSNLLQICCIADQKDAYQICAKLISEKDLTNLYLKSNSRGINNLFVASMCWRHAVGQMLFDSQFCQKLINKSFSTDFTNIVTRSPVEIVQMTNSVYLAQFLQSQTQNLDFKNKFYMQILKHNMPKIYRDQAKITFASNAEANFVQQWLNAVLEDAVTHAIQNVAEIQWNQVLKGCVGRNLEAIVKQQQKYGVLIANCCEIEIDELIKQELLNTKQNTQYTRVNLSAQQKTSVKSLTTTFMENTHVKKNETQAKTFMTKKDIMNKTNLMKTKIDKACSVPKWIALDRLYQDIVAGQTEIQVSETQE